MFFSSFESVVRTIVMAVLAYAGLVLFLRISGKRTLSKMNAFDLVVTVALGSSLASVIVSKQTTLTDGLVAFAALIGLQYVVAATSVRARWFRRIVKSDPKLIVYDGKFLDTEMKRERVTVEEVLAALRQGGIADAAAAQAVVLETDGSFTVIRRDERKAIASTLEHVAGNRPRHVCGQSPG